MIMTYLLLILGFIYLLLYLGFITGLKEPVNASMYFNKIFSSYRDSRLRTIWSTLVFILEYSIALIITLFIKIAWCPAKWTRFLVSKILFK